MFGLGHWELAVVVVVAIVLFGNRIPKLCRSLGESVGIIRRIVDE